MSEESRIDEQQHLSDDLTTDFEEIKEVASKNISSMLKDLQDFEEAIENENIPEIYRIYKGRLHKELKETSNQHHEIDELLSRKIHDSFVRRFPFMQYTEKITPTMHYYTISSYYRERATIGIDSSIPEIFILPKIDEEWQYYQPTNRETLTEIEQEIDRLEANFIAAETEVDSINQQLKEIENKKAAIHNNKGFFNRAKTDEDLEELEQAAKKLIKQKEKWLPFIENKSSTNHQKELLMQRYQETRLKRAVVTKEYRLITEYFGSFSEMSVQLQAFLDQYLTPRKGENENE